MCSIFDWRNENRFADIFFRSPAILADAFSYRSELPARHITIVGHGRSIAGAAGCELSTNLHFLLFVLFHFRRMAWMQCIYLFRLFRIAFCFLIFIFLFVFSLLLSTFNSSRFVCVICAQYVFCNCLERIDLFITLALRISKHTF